MKKVFLFFSTRDPDLRIFIQVLTMCLCNLIGLFLWLIVRLECSPLIVLAPGIMVAIVFTQNEIRERINLILLTAFVIILFQFGVIMLQRQKIMLLFWVFFVTYYMFSSPKLRYVSSYALLPCVTAFTMRLGFLSAIDRTAEAIMSAVFTIVVLLVMQEITAKIRIKKIMLMYASEVHDYFMCQTEIKHKDSCTCTNRENLRLFAIKAINVVNKQEYILKSNVKYAKNASTLLMSLHHLSRTPNFVKNIKNSSEYDSLIKYFDSLFCKLVDDLKRSREIKLNISKKLVTKFSNNDAVTLNGFYNQYAVKGIINDFQQINGFNLE